MSLQTTLMAVGLFVGGADQAPGDVSPLDDREKSFIDTIAAVDRAEMELSRAIEARSTNPAVRRLAHTLLAEDAANYHELFRLCLSKTYAIAPQLDERHGAVLERVKSAPSAGGARIEQTYLETVRLDKADIGELLERISADATDGELSRFAAETLAMVQKHQAMLRDLETNTRG